MKRLRPKEMYSMPSTIKKSSGMVPVNVFWKMSKYFIGRRERPLGMVPVKTLLVISKKSMRDAG